MRRVIILPFGLLAWILWYVVSPSFLPSRYPVHYSDGSFHEIGVVQWTTWLLSPTPTGTAFRRFIYLAHKPLFFAYGGVFLLCVAFPMLFLSVKGTGYKDRLKSGQNVLPDTWWGRFKIRLLSLRKKGAHFSPVQKIDRALEPTHLAILGSTGSGKTQAILRLIKDIMARGEKCVVLDSKGDYTAWLGDPVTSVLLSPGDSRTPLWKVGRDLSRPDIDLVVSALIEEDPHMAAEWHLAARAAMRAVLLFAQTERPEFTFHDLDAALNPDVVIYAAGKYDPKLYATLKNRDSETSRGVLFVLNSLSQGLAEISAGDESAREFSMREWLLSPRQTSLIIKRHPSQAFSFRLTSRLVLGILQGLVMNMPDDRNRRVWLIMDELSVLRKFPPLVDFLERGRSKGLCVVAGIQDWGTMEQFYEAEARTLYTCFVNKVFLSMREPVSAKYYSDSLGESVFDRTTTTANRNNVFSVMPALSTQIQTQNRPTISPGDLLRTPPPDPKKRRIFGYTQISGYPLAKISFKIEPMPSYYPDFIPAEPGRIEREEKAPQTALPIFPETRPKRDDKKPGDTGDGEKMTKKRSVNPTARIPDFIGSDVIDIEDDLGIVKEKEVDEKEEENLQYTKTTLTEKFHPEDTPGNNLKEFETVAKDLGKLLVGGMTGIPVGEFFEAEKIVEDSVEKKLTPEEKKALKKEKKDQEIPVQNKSKLKFKI